MKFLRAFIALPALMLLMFSVPAASAPIDIVFEVSGGAGNGSAATTFTGTTTVRVAGGSLALGGPISNGPATQIGIQLNLATALTLFGGLGSVTKFTRSATIAGTATRFDVEPVLVQQGVHFNTSLVPTNGAPLKQLRASMGQYFSTWPWASTIWDWGARASLQIAIPTIITDQLVFVGTGQEVSRTLVPAPPALDLLLTTGAFALAGRLGVASLAPGDSSPG
jgi:hypothetical protein